jgi:hypothetical protein
MATFLQLKNATANQLGKSDGGTANTIRDNHINDVVRNEIADAYPFSWARVSTTLSIDTAGQSDLPADYNPSHKMYDARVVTSGYGNDTIYYEVQREVFDSIGATNYFFIDYNTSTNRYRVNARATSVTLTIVYYAKPTAMTADTDVCIVPDQDVIAFLAAARYWLSSERDETNHDRFQALGNQKLQQLITNDKKANPRRSSRGSMYGSNLGWNTP